MLFDPQKQRRGKAPVWVIVALAGVYVALAWYEYGVNRDRQEQDEERMEELRRAGLRGVDYGADPDDWPQWRGPNRDGAAPGKRLLTDWPEGGPPVLWRAEGGPGYSSLAVADGRVVTLVQDGDDEAVVCWDAETGKRRWRHAYPGRFAREGAGPRSTPAIDGDRVYTVGARGDLHCLDVRTGAVKWSHDLLAVAGAAVPRWGFAFSPLVEGDLLLTSPGGPDGNSIVAFDKYTGYKRWSALSDPAGYSSPVISTACGVRQALFFTGNALVSLDPQTGKLYWRFDWPTPNEANVATPLVRGDYVFISSGYDTGCAVVEVVREKGGALRARPVYRYNLMRNHFASCVFHDDHLYGFDEAYLVCMPFREGKRRLWKERKFHRGSLLLAGDRLVVLGERGNLALVEPSPDGYREKAIFQVSEGRCWTMPALAQDRLYVRDEKQVLCLDLRRR